jgi:hypothetical protein
LVVGAPVRDVLGTFGPLQALEEIASAATARHRLLRKSRFRHGVAVQQYLRDRVATEERHNADVPEVARAEWFDLETARSKILSGQIELIDRLEAATG